MARPVLVELHMARPVLVTMSRILAFQFVGALTALGAIADQSAVSEGMGLRVDRMTDCIT